MTGQGEGMNKAAFRDDEMLDLRHLHCQSLYILVPD